MIWECDYQIKELFLTLTSESSNYNCCRSASRNGFLPVRLKPRTSAESTNVITSFTRLVTEILSFLQTVKPTRIHHQNSRNKQCFVQSRLNWKTLLVSSIRHWGLWITTQRTPAFFNKLFAGGNLLLLVRYKRIPKRPMALTTLVGSAGRKGMQICCPIIISCLAATVHCMQVRG